MECVLLGGFVVSFCGSSLQRGFKNVQSPQLFRGKPRRSYRHSETMVAH